MLTLVIVKTRIDSSLNLYEHCVACGDENNCRALRGQPCGAAYPLTCFDLRCTPLVEVLKHLEKRCTSTFCLQRWPAQCARRLFTSTNTPQRQNKRFLAYFWCILAVSGKRPVLGLLVAALRTVRRLTGGSRGFSEYMALGPNILGFR